jgi:son of sevenless-like protein
MDPKIVENFELLRKLMSSDGNYEAFRTALHSESPPSIPYLGMYLTDLTFIEDGNPDKLADGLINFAKRRRIATVILEIQQYQHTPYALQPVPAIINLLSGGLQGLDEKQAYNMSLIVEPRESK